MRAALLSLLLLGGCSVADSCENHVIEAKRDLAGSLMAWRYTRDCGATAEASMNIAVGDSGGGLEGAETVFTADTNHGAAEMDGAEMWVALQWTGPHRLSVAYAEKARLFKSEAAARGAAIQYRATNRDVHFAPPPLPDQGVDLLTGGGPR
jgi:hypothetical protein